MARRRSSRSNYRRRSSRGGYRRRSHGNYGAIVLVLAVIVGVVAYLHGHPGTKLSIGTGSNGGSGSSGSNGSGTGSAPAGGGTVAAGGTVFAFATGNGTTTEPTIYQVLDSARSSIDLTMYELSDTTAVNDLIARKKAGVNVRVILDQAERTTNQSAYNTLTGAKIPVVWSSTAFAYTHQKTLTVDDDESLILTGNLTSNYYAETRDFGVIDKDRNDVGAVVAVFNADFAHKTITPSDADDLLWSPTTAQSRILSVIAGAHKTIDVEAEEFNDPAVVNALAQKAKEGVAVRIVVETPSQYQSSINKVVSAGGRVVGYSSKTGLYIHAKVVLADAGQPDQMLELGSMNLTANSLGSNRELGIILHDAPDCSLVEKQFDADYSGGAKAGGA